MDRPAVQKHVDYVWILISGVMVFFMQAGFAMLEMGSSRAKNSINCAMKGLLDFSSSSISYLLFGFTLMFGPSSGGFIGSHSFWLSDFPASSPLWVFWFFQVVFCGAACTIASGAMAERTKFMGYMAYTAFFSGLVYPVFGHWAWGSASTGYEANFGGGTGWLEALGFVDFAGSTVVHGIGGACALAGIMVVGPRVGRFDADGNGEIDLQEWEVARRQAIQTVEQQHHEMRQTSELSVVRAPADGRMFLISTLPPHRLRQRYFWWSLFHLGVALLGAGGLIWWSR
jgi:Amt family ammonium transporter